MRAKKRFGQNFLVSEEIIARIVESINPRSTDTIIEIGPGRGALTLPLSESGAKILAVEFDRALVQKLEQEFSGHKNVAIIQKDFLRFIPAEYGLTKFKLCGNLPFNISSPVIDWIVYHRALIEKAVIMLQHEVALRLTSRPGTKDWSPLAIFTQLYFDSKILIKVPPKHFRPSPKVISAVVELIPKTETEIPHYKEFEQLVRASFRQRRKLLLNNLVPAIIPASETANEFFQMLGFNPKIRAEQLETGQFLELTGLLVKHNMFETNTSERK